MAYETIRDVAVLTNKRLIIRDAQGVTDADVEMLSLSYSSIGLWSAEVARDLFANTEVDLWTRAGLVKIHLNKGMNVRKFENLIAEAVP